MEEVEAKFLTALPEAYRLPASTFSLPISITAEGLYQIVAQQVEVKDRLVFMVNNVVVTTTLGELMRELRLTSESLLEIWYALALPLPSTQSTHTAPDWVSSVAFLSPTTLISADYSGTVSVYRDCQPFLTEQLHSFPIKSVAVTRERGGLIATGGKEGSLKVSGIRSEEWELKAEGKLSSVETLAWNPTGTMVAAGLFCGEVYIASIDFEESAMLTKASKRQKLGSFGIRTQRLSVPHSDTVSALQWPELDVMYTASHDHSVIVWDVSQESAAFSYTAPRSIQSFHAANRLLACGFENGHIKIVDERSNQTVATLCSESFVRSLHWYQGSLLSGHENGEINVWDVRANTPLETGEKHKGKILTIAVEGDIVATGGADSTVQFHKFVR